MTTAVHPGLRFLVGALQLDRVPARRRMNKSMLISLGFHAVLVPVVLLTIGRGGHTEDLEEITWLEEEPVSAPAPVALPERPAGPPIEASPAPPAAPKAAAPEPPAPKPAARAPETAAKPPAAPVPAPPAGETGRKVAEQKVAASLAGVTRSADDAIEGLNAVLGAKPATAAPRPGARRKSVSSGRGSSDLAAVGGGTAGVTGGADLASSAVQSGGVRVENISWSTKGGGGAAGGSGSAGGSGGASGGAVALSERTQASLLGVVRRYAPGIQFCYDNQLKHSPGLRGKLVAAITVTAVGKVQEARIVTDTLKSADLASCVRSQILDWKFPAVPEGTVTFEAPFVFTPPRN